MAFLEGQALQELGQTRVPLDSRGREAAAGHVASRANTAWDQARILLAVAASFVVSAGFGTGCAGLLLFAGKEGIPGGNINTQRPVFVAEEQPDEGVPHNVLRYVGDVRLLVDGATDGGQVPVYEVGQNVTDYLAGESAVLGPEMIELLKQYGYDVRQDQQLFPASLDDGRQIIVPVEGYQITPVSRRY